MKTTYTAELSNGEVHTRTSKADYKYANVWILNGKVLEVRFSKNNKPSSSWAWSRKIDSKGWVHESVSLKVGA